MLSSKYNIILSLGMASLFLALYLAERQKPNFEVESQSVYEPDMSTIPQNGVLISYCTSCSMKNLFEQVKHHIEKYFPDRPVFSETYPISKKMETYGNVAWLLQIVISASVLSIKLLYGLSGLQPPKLFEMLLQRYFQIIMLTWSLTAMAQQYFRSTGAFEIYTHDGLIFSKLTRQQNPTWEEIQQGLVPKPISVSDF